MKSTKLEMYWVTLLNIYTGAEEIYLMSKSELDHFFNYYFNIASVEPIS